MRPIRLVTLILTLLAALPASAQTRALFDDDIRFGSKYGCTAAYVVADYLMENGEDPYAQALAAAGFSAETFRARSQALFPAVVADSGSVEKAKENLSQLAWQYQELVVWASLGHAALNHDSFFRFLGRCDAQYGHSPSSEIASVQLAIAGTIGLDGTPVEPAGGRASFFDNALFSSREGCGANYLFMYLVQKGDELGFNQQFPAELMLNTFGAEGLAEIDYLARYQDLVRAGINSGNEIDKAKVTAFLESFVEIPANLSTTERILDAREMSAWADTLTRCDRKYGYHPRSRTMFDPNPTDWLESEAGCIASVDIAIAELEAAGQEVPPGFHEARDLIFARQGAASDLDKRDMMEDRALTVKDYWGLEASPEAAQAKVRACFP